MKLLCGFCVERFMNLLLSLPKLMKLRAFIPNLFTLANALCGSLAVVSVLQEDFRTTALLVFLGMFFDFFDGFLARKLHVTSKLGVQLDSLADLISFGLVPGLVIFVLLTNVAETTVVIGSSQFSPMALTGFLIPLASAYRLARFNIDDRQTENFIGLPTPANAIFFVSLPLLWEHSELVGAHELLVNPVFLIATTLISAYLLNSSWPLFSLKFKIFELRSNGLRYGFLVSALVLLLLFSTAALPIIVILYVLSGILKKLF